MPNPRLNQAADIFMEPAVPTGGLLPPSFSLVIPTGLDETNLIANPSFETNTTNWQHTDTISEVVTRDATEQYFGAYSLTGTVAIPGTNYGYIYGITTPLSLTSGVDYVLSTYFWCNTGGLPFTLNVTTTANVAVKTLRFTSTGGWQRVWMVYRETSTTSRRINIRNAHPTRSFVFNIDGVNMVATTSGQLPVLTTHIDGDQQGFIPDEFPPAYYWNGTPHASTSVRKGTTRSGGRIVNLRDLGLSLAAITGLGLPIPQHASIPLSQLDGEIYQRTQKAARTFTLAGRVTRRSNQLLDEAFDLLSSSLDIDAAPRQQPLLLKYQPMDEYEVPTGPELDIVCTYMGGLEGLRNNTNTDIFTISFKQYLPNLLGHSEGAILDPSDTVTNANGAIRRSSAGVWAALSTGVSGGAVTRVNAIAAHPNGTIYIGGDFTDAGGSGAAYAAIYIPSTNQFTFLGAGVGNFNAIVEAIVIGPTGLVYLGGQFTNANGIANADGIVQYNPTTGTFAALGTGVSAASIVSCLAMDKAGNLYAGGSFNPMGGVANAVRIARWNGSVWNAMGTGTNGTTVGSIAARGTDIFITGDFTLAGGVADTARVARWDGTAWNALLTGLNASPSGTVMVSRTGLVYIVGGASPNSDTSIVGIMTWNGVKFSAVGVNAPVTNLGGFRCIVEAPNGSLILCGTFDELNDIAYPDSLAIFDGATYQPMDADLPGTAGVTGLGALAFDRAGTLYVAFNATGSATVPGRITTTHSGNGKAYPKVTIQNAAGSTARVYQIANTTTERTVRMNLTLQPSEVVTLNFDPQNLFFRGTFQGDISSTILPGSDEADFFITRGSNTIAVLISGSVDVVIEWRQAFLSAAAAAGKI